MPMVVGILEAVQFSLHVECELFRGRVVDQNVESQGSALSSWQQSVFLVVEGSVLSECRPSLQGCVATLFLNQKRVWQQPLSLITPVDSVLEARVRRLESLVDGILATEMDPASRDPIERAMAKRRATLQKLGWKPYQPIDHRSLTIPLLVTPRDLLRVRVECGEDGPEREVPFRIYMSGVEKHVLL